MPTQTRRTKPKATESGQTQPKTTRSKTNQAKTNQADSTQAETPQTSQTKAKQTKASQAEAKKATTRSAQSRQTKASQTKTTQAEAKKTQAKTSRAETDQTPEAAKPEGLAFSITAPQSRLSNLLTTVAPAVSTNPTNPILSYLKLEALAGACQITATDTSYTITATADCNTVHQGVGLLPTQLANVIQAIPPSETLALVGSTVEGATKIELSNGSGVISTTPITRLVDHFLVTDLTNPRFQHGLSTENLKLALQTVLGSAGPKEKGILHAVHVIFEADTLVCQATDGHQIAIARLDARELGRSKRQTAAIDCRLPLDTVKALIKLLAQATKDSEVEFRLDSGEAPKAQFHIQTNQAQVTLTCQCLADSYPDIQRVIQPFTYGTSALVNRIALIQQAQVIKAMGAKTPVAKLTLRDTSLHLSMDGNEVSGTQTVQAALDMPDPKFETALNLDLLLNLARAATGDQLRLEFGHRESLIKLSPTAPDLDGLEIIGYMMPVKVSQPDPTT